MLSAVALAGCGNDDDTPDATPPTQETPVTPAAPATQTPVTPAPAAGITTPAAPEATPTPTPTPAPETPATPAPSATPSAAGVDLENTLYIERFCGRVEIAMQPDIAPLHVERIKTLARRGFYDGLIFHRVIAGFMAQTGDPSGPGMGGADDLPDLPAEFNDRPFVRGAMGMARTSAPNSANSQFFITYADAPWLNGQYTLWGNVTAGMDCVDQIARGEPPANPDRMLTVRVAADVQ
jgi:peptidylprolyl isomerase